VSSSTTAAFAVLQTKLTQLRQAVQARRVSAVDVDAFFFQLGILSNPYTEAAARTSTTASAAVNLTTVASLGSVGAWHSSAAALGAGWAESGVLSQTERLTVARLAGAYRDGLQALADQLPTAAYQQLTGGSAWKLAGVGETNLTQTGKLGVPLAGWLKAEESLTVGLFGMYGNVMRLSENATSTVAGQTLSRSIWLGSLVLLLTIAAFVAALLLASRLAGRLQRLRDKTIELADVQLPSMVRRIGDGEPVDVESEMGLLDLDYGTDEVGQVAAAFNSAQRTAVASAAAESRTRSGISKVFVDIAHRSQLVVHRQLELLDVAEARQADPEHLELLFQLDHLATRARRNAENLLILGGGQPGRRWRDPAALEDVVRSAVSETEHFDRVDTVRLPDARVQGAVVGDLIHLLAELVDNATAFSPPSSMVNIRGNGVGKGVAIEIDDQGLGIQAAELHRLNETLRNPPGFQAMALSGQQRLGLFVVGQLAQRHGISVTLMESAYGGIRAVVLVPSTVIESPVAANDNTLAPGRGGRHSQLPPATAQPGQRLLARPAIGDGINGNGINGNGINGNGAGAPDRAAATNPPVRPVPVNEPASAPWEISAEPASAPWETTPEPAPAPGTHRRAALPRRERLANLAPGLRSNGGGPDGGRPADQAAPGRSRRSAEDARSSMSAFQRGTRQGRNPAREDES
jgi:signal transduction histidine kinase